MKPTVYVATPLADPWVPSSNRPTHIGPDGPVRAHQWQGHMYGGARLFLDSAGPVAYWLEQNRLAVDLEHGPVQHAHPGDWLVWAGDELTVVLSADFTADYRLR
jgi:hypothetical protein